MRLVTTAIDIRQPSLPDQTVSPPCLWRVSRYAPIFALQDRTGWFKDGCSADSSSAHSSAHSGLAKRGPLPVP